MWSGGCGLLLCLVLCSQFINDKFLYDHSVAMKMLIKSGMKAQLFELAQVGNTIRYITHTLKNVESLIKTILILAHSN